MQEQPLENSLGAIQTRQNRSMTQGSVRHHFEELIRKVRRGEADSEAQWEEMTDEYETMENQKLLSILKQNKKLQ